MHHLAIFQGLCEAFNHPVHGDREHPAPDSRIDHLWLRVRDPHASRRFSTTASSRWSSPPGGAADARNSSVSTLRSRSRVGSAPTARAALALTGLHGRRLSCCHSVRFGAPPAARVRSPSRCALSIGPVPRCSADEAGRAGRKSGCGCRDLGRGGAIGRDPRTGLDLTSPTEGRRQFVACLNAGEWWSMVAGIPKNRPPW